MFKKKLGLWILVLALFVTIGGQTAFATSDTSTTAQSWDVDVSIVNSTEVIIFSMQPRTLIIHEGDTVNFTNRGVAAPHTVTFWGQTTPAAPDDSFAAPSVPNGSSWDGKSMINSGLMFPGQSYSITFTGSGVYPYLCLLHPAMVGDIIVVPKGQPIPSKADQQAQQAAKLKELDQQVASIKKERSVTSYAKNKDGSFTYSGYAGSGTPELMINAYSPNTYYINEGDSITWNTDAPDFQFVFFNLPKGFVPIKDNGDFDPLLETPTGGPDFDGKETISSGPIMPAMPAMAGMPAMPAMPFTLKFSKAGTYTFTDPVWGKSGKVIVAPKGAAKLVVNNVPIVTDVQVKQGQTLVPSTVVAKLTKQKLVVGKDIVKYTINKKTYVSIQEVVAKVGGTYNYDAAIKLVTVTAK
ncbi:cupredoxin domain-containing protein [Cohnella yongneupensis]|uniref:Plastocyanin/azurin family copper-binding protein n=1 Tax=Cohnella yongneupensis TaxID=425006 RepID=A0ABW0R907_9BACL